jgi:colanic acid/amylovoran biosynthesis glycosyltransferase
LPWRRSIPGGLSEEVLDGETGLVAPERDVAALARHLETLLTSQPLWSRLSQRAPAFVRERFDVRRQTAALETLYDDVLAAARHVA